MSKLFLISEEEKNRILNLHESMSKKTTKLRELELKEVVGRVLMEQTYEDKVTAVQQALVDLGYDLGDYGSKGDGVDGDFGSATKNAVIKFQTDKGISPNKGVVGPKTAAALGVEPLYTKTAGGSSSSSSGSGDSSGSASDSPFKTREEGNAFRKWLNNNYKAIADKFELDREGSHTNKNILNAFNAIIPNTKTSWGQFYLSKTQQGQTQPGQTAGKDSISSNVETKFTNKFNLAALDSTKSTPIFREQQPDCAQFVNNWYTKKDYVGNAWNAHDYDGAGTRVKTAYHGLTEPQIKTVNNIFQAIAKQGGPIERKESSIITSIKSLHQQLNPNITASDLKKDDIVGIYYPSSSHHEEAFFQAALSGFEPNELPKGKGYFIKDGKGGWKPGTTISRGVGFGMNTHLGIVGAIKNGVPIVFHNINKQVYADPYNKLFGNGKIMWVKRS
jgi:peptidoglycan hydrolase-like protein with peptidoglycan-binding domain